MFQKLSQLLAFLNQNSLNKEAEVVETLLKYAGILEDLITEYPEYAEPLKLAAQTVKPNHLKWVVQQLQRNEPINEIINTIAEFKKFSQRLEKKDLYQYQRLADLRTAIEMLGDSKQSKKKKERSELEGQFEKIYESSKFIVIHPQTKQASCYFGRGTQWCVAATVSENYFQSYAADNVFLYYILTKSPEDPNSSFNKIAYAYNKEYDDLEIFDMQDNSIDESYVMSHLGDEFSAIQQAILSHFNSKENTPIKEKILNMSFEEFIKEVNFIEDEEDKRQFAEHFFDRTEEDKEFVNYFAEYGATHLKEMLMDRNPNDKELHKKIILTADIPIVLNYLHRSIVDKKLINDLFNKTLNKKPDVTNAILESKHVTEEIFNYVLNSKRNDLIEIVAKNWYLNTEQIKKIYEKVIELSYREIDKKTISYNLVGHTFNRVVTAPSEVIQDVYNKYKDEMEEEEWDIFEKNNSTPPDVLVDILKKRMKIISKYDYSRLTYLLKNKNLPEFAYRELYKFATKDFNYFVLQELAVSEKTPIDILENLAVIKGNIQELILDNKSAKTPRILELLSLTGSSQFVREFASQLLSEVNSTEIRK